MEDKTKYKYKFTVYIKSLECTIPYDAKVAIKLIRGNKSVETKTKVDVSSQSGRNFKFDDAITILSTLEYNPHLGCCEEKKALLRWVTYKTSDTAKRIGEWSINLWNFAKIPENGKTPEDLSKFKFSKDWVEKVGKSIDRFSLIHFTVNSELVEVDGDDTFSMYYVGDNDDTVTDASWMEQVKEMNDKSYYSKGLGSELKTKITLDLTADHEEIPIIQSETVDRFGRSLEKPVPFEFDWEDNHSTPEKQNSENSEEDLSHQNNERIIELEQQLAEKENDIGKLKKKLDEAKTKSDKKETTINNLLKDIENLSKVNTIIDEKLKDYELANSQLTLEKEQLNKMIKMLQSKNSNKENETIDMLKQNLDSKNAEILELTTNVKTENGMLKSQFESVKNELIKLKASYDELKSKYDKSVENCETLSDSRQKEIDELKYKHETDLKTLQSKYLTEIDDLVQRITAKENVINEIQNQNKLYDSMPKCKYQ